MSAAGAELTLSEPLAVGIVDWVGGVWNVCPRSVSLSQPGSGRVRLSPVCLQEVCGCLVFVPARGCASPGLVWTPGVGEGFSYPKARVEVRVDCEPAAAGGPGNRCECGGGATPRREEPSWGNRGGKFRGTGGEQCVG